MCLSGKVQAVNVDPVVFPGQEASITETQLLNANMK